MATPTTREEFKAYILRGLGAPVIEINVDDDQVEDRIDEAIKYWQDYHYDGSEKVYLDHTINANTVANKTITLDDTIIGVVGIFDTGWGGLTGDPLTNIPYQIYVSDIQNGSMTDTMSNYVVLRTNLAMFQEILVGKVPIRYTRHRDTLYLDISASKLQVGNHIIIEAYQKNDPATYTDAWGDWWLQRYAKALVKRQWGANLSKFSGIPLPGGLTLDGKSIYQEAVDEIEKMESDMINSFSMPVHDMTG